MRRGAAHSSVHEAGRDETAVWPAESIHALNVSQLVTRGAHLITVNQCHSDVPLEQRTALPHTGS